MIKKSLWNLLSFFLLLSIPSISYSMYPVHKDSIKTFREVSIRLSSLKNISYHYSRELNYPSEKYNSKSGGDMYIEFDKENDLYGFKYQYKEKNFVSVFNNSEIFDADHNKKTISTKTGLNQRSLEGQSPVYNSIITLRNALPLIIEDGSVIKKVADTVVNNRSYYLLQFEMKNKYPSYLGRPIDTTSIEITFMHKMIVDKGTLLPVSLIRTTKGTGDLTRTDFGNINLNPALPSENSWYYSSYLNDYQPEKKVVVEIIKPGVVAPKFALKNHLSKTTIELAQYQGRLVLLEFWIKNCGPCIASVPKLNIMHKKYSPKALQILAINTQDSDSMIEVFMKKNEVKYPVLQGNNTSVAKDYGIPAYPQVVLIDKKGTVIYSGGFDAEVISTLIEKNS